LIQINRMATVSLANLSFLLKIDWPAPFAAARVFFVDAYRKLDMNRLLRLALLLFVFVSVLPPLLAQDHALLQHADGLTDATETMQRLVNQRKGLVEIPPGTFKLTKTIEVDLVADGYCSLRGSSATQLVMAGSGPAIRFRGSHFKSADPAGFRPQVWETERMPSVSDLAISGTHEQADGIEAVGTMQLTVSHVHLRKLRHGIHLIENNRNVLIDACHIYENRGIGVFYDQVNLHQSNIVGCHISYCSEGGIVSRGGNVRNIHIAGCDIEGNVGPQAEATANVFIDCRDSDYGTAEVAITGCTIQHSHDGPDSANIRIIGRSNPTSKGQTQEGHVTITGNVMSDVQHNVWLDACRGVTLTGNTFWMGYQHNLLIENCSHIVMSANNFDRNPRYDYGTSRTTLNALYIRNSRDCTLAGLHIADVGEGLPGLALENCDRFHVSGLTILDCDIGLQMKNVTRTRISDCMIRDDREGAASQRVVIEGGEGNDFDESIKKLQGSR
jgi:hypothetical protein